MPDNRSTLVDDPLNEMGLHHIAAIRDSVKKSATKNRGRLRWLESFWWGRLLLAAPSCSPSYLPNIASMVSTSNVVVIEASMGRSGLQWPLTNSFILNGGLM
jgi:hypothetical protein